MSLKEIMITNKKNTLTILSELFVANYTKNYSSMICLAFGNNDGKSPSYYMSKTKNIALYMDCLV